MDAKAPPRTHEKKRTTRPPRRAEPPRANKKKRSTKPPRRAGPRPAIPETKASLSQIYVDRRLTFRGPGGRKTVVEPGLYFVTHAGPKTIRLRRPDRRSALTLVASEGSHGLKVRQSVALASPIEAGRTRGTEIAVVLPDGRLLQAIGYAGRPRRLTGLKSSKKKRISQLLAQRTKANVSVSPKQPTLHARRGDTVKIRLDAEGSLRPKADVIVLKNGRKIATVAEATNTGGVVNWRPTGKLRPGKYAIVAKTVEGNVLSVSTLVLATGGSGTAGDGGNTATTGEECQALWAQLNSNKYDAAACRSIADQITAADCYSVTSNTVYQNPQQEVCDLTHCQSLWGQLSTKKYDTAECSTIAQEIASLDCYTLTSNTVYLNVQEDVCDLTRCQSLWGQLNTKKYDPAECSTIAQEITSLNCYDLTSNTVYRDVQENVCNKTECQTLWGQLNTKKYDPAECSTIAQRMTELDCYALTSNTVYQNVQVNVCDKTQCQTLWGQLQSKLGTPECVGIVNQITGLDCYALTSNTVYNITDAEAYCAAG